MEEKIKKIELELKNIKEELNQEYKIGDIVNYCGYEWYVIDIINNQLKLMLKNVIYTCTYSDENSNDYVESNVRKFLAKFSQKLNVKNLKDMTVNYDENRYYSTKVRIPTLREIEKLSMDIKNCGESYWTMTSSYAVSENNSYAWVFYVNDSGYLGYTYVPNTDIGVRPVIMISKEVL